MELQQEGLNADVFIGAHALGDTGGAAVEAAFPAIIGAEVAGKVGVAACVAPRRPLQPGRAGRRATLRSIIAEGELVW